MFLNYNFTGILPENSVLNSLSASSNKPYINKQTKGLTSSDFTYHLVNKMTPNMYYNQIRCLYFAGKSTGQADSNTSK
jgi:hypothetical protein